MLVLNASMEPLAVVDARRAIVLAIGGKADIVHENGVAFRSPSVTIQAPTVLRLHRQVRVPRRGRAGLSRRAVFLRDGHRCQYCGRPAEDVDHVVPRSRGGEHAWENVVASCRRCNGHKQDRTPTEAGFELSGVPRVPPPAFWLLVRAGRVSHDWRPYLAPYLGDRWIATLDLMPVT
ncbi:MAG TPA: HNH endonuclease [Nitriliruptorales bacterium]